MNVLILDDRYMVNTAIADVFNKNGYTTLQCSNVYEADEQLAQYHIDYFIVDLSMPTAGLSEDERIQTKGGMLTGWVWLISHVYDNKEDERIRATVIFSEYLEEAKKITLTDESLWPDAFSSVAKLQKSSVGSEGFHVLIETVRNLSKGD